MTIAHGETRTVFIFKNYVVKIPTLRKGYRQFLYGLISNHQETIWSGQNPFLLPVVWSSIGSFAIVLPKVEICKSVPSNFTEITKSLGKYPKVDKKPESFGIYHGKVFVIDYGTTV